MQPWRRIGWLLLGLSGLACGDDGSKDDGLTGFGSEGSTSTTSGATVTDSTTGSTSSSTGTGTSTSSTSTTSGAATSDGGSTTTEASTGDSTTGSPAACEEATDETTCVAIVGCIWLDTSDGGQCVVMGDQCAGVTLQMQCNFISGCTWDAEQMRCVGV